MITAQGNLTIIGANTPELKVFWNGKLVPNVVELKTEWEKDEHRVKLRVTGDDPMFGELAIAGIHIKKVTK